MKITLENVRFESSTAPHRLHVRAGIVGNDANSDVSFEVILLVDDYKNLVVGEIESMAAKKFLGLTNSSK